jgi:hypothetical protein
MIYQNDKLFICIIKISYIIIFEAMHCEFVMPLTGGEMLPRRELPLIVVHDESQDMGGVLFFAYYVRYSTGASVHM